MSETPYMPLWVGDFLAKTEDLNDAETGAYMRLIMAQWSRCGRSLPTDQTKLQRIAHSGRNWPKVWAEIVRFFDQDDAGYFNRTCREMYEKRAAQAAVKSASGERGGHAKALKYNNRGVANARNSAEQNPSMSYPYPESEGKEEETYGETHGVSSQKMPPKSRIPEGWVLSDGGWEYARSQGIPDGVIEDEAKGFHAYWSDRRDRDASKSERGWEQCWASRCRAIARKFAPRGMAGTTQAAGRGQGGGIAGIVARRRLGG